MQRKISTLTVGNGPSTIFKKRATIGVLFPIWDKN